MTRSEFAGEGLKLCGANCFLQQLFVQHTDDVAGCQQIIAEIKANNETISDLASDEGLKVTQNVAAGVAGIVSPVLWFGMEFQDAAGKEGKALSQTNEDLAGLAKKRW